MQETKNPHKKMKKICLVMVGYLKDYPPVLTFLQVAKELGFDITVLAAGDNSNIEKYPGYSFKGIKSVDVIGEYRSDIPQWQKLIRMFNIHRKVWKALSSKELLDVPLIIVSEITVKHLGNKLLSRDYILYQLELIEGYQIIPKKNILKLNTKLIGNGAKSVVVCEYNRAHITKAWWKLDRLPQIIKNKPFVPELDMSNLPSSVKLAREAIKDKANGRKIILYQGIIGKERPIDLFAIALAQRSKECLFVVMGNKEPDFGDSMVPENYIFVPFVSPPFHLAITAMAYVGVMVYLPGCSSSYSDLNTVYCAPNKIWEYAKYGVPMISNDVPALATEFSQHFIGVCSDSLNSEDILKAYDYVDQNHQRMAQNALEYYANYDVKNAINNVLDVLG